MLTARIRKNAANAAIDRAVREALAAAGRNGRTRTTFELLLRQARRSSLLDHGSVGGRSGATGCGEIIAGLLALATHHKEWIRPLEEWEPNGISPLPRFSSLARHLLAAYAAPHFMTPLWFEGRSVEARRRQGWYLHIGSGRNIRTADLLLPYTKKMAHEFLQAPDHFTVEAALRWGQVRGLGGSKELALALTATRLGRSFESEDFWATVVHFFVNHPDLGLDQVGPVVDYLHHQRFIPEELFLNDGLRVELDPPQPNLSMKGRTPRSLLRQVGDWHDKLKRPRKSPLLMWKPSGIGDFRHVEREAPRGSGAGRSANSPPARNSGGRERRCGIAWRAMP